MCQAQLFYSFSSHKAIFCLVDEIVVQLLATTWATIVSLLVLATGIILRNILILILKESICPIN